MRSTTPATRTPASSWWRRRRASRSRREGGAHQSIAQPLIGMAQDGLAAFEPAFVDELAAIIALRLRLHPEGRRRRSLRAQLAARRDRRLGLSAALDAAGRADQADDDAGAAPGHRRRRLLAAQARPELPGGRRLYRRGRARGDPGGRADGGGPPRRRPACGHLGRPAQCRLDRGAARARARPRPCALAYRAAARPTCPRTLRHRHRARRPSGDAWPGSARCTAIARARSASSISARPARSPTSTGTTASTPTPSSPPPRRSRRAGRSGTSARSDDGRASEAFRSPSSAAARSD